jgi:hypothetical protein
LQANMRLICTNACWDELSMSGSSKLLSESESARIAGVSIETIRQYAQFGLLEPRLENGVTHFRESEIRSIFYTKNEEIAPTPAEGPTPSETSPKSAALDITSGTSHEVSTASASPGTMATTPPPEQASPKPQENMPQPNQEQEAAAKLAPAPEDYLTTLESILAAETPKPLEPEPSADGYSPNTQEGRVQTLKSQTTSSQNGETQTWETQAQHSRRSAASYTGSSTLELMEANRGLRSQIEILQEERDWLRKRVEKLEGQAEREQMLLLAESETVRSLIKNQDRTRSFWTFALPWFSSSGTGK